LRQAQVDHWPKYAITMDWRIVDDKEASQFAD